MTRETGRQTGLLNNGTNQRCSHHPAPDLFLAATERMVFCLTEHAPFR